VIVVVGIGADGWSGLTDASRAAVLAADEVVGSARQLASLPSEAGPRRPWPSPIDPLVDELVARDDGDVCVLASGDPMLHGIGATLARRVDPDRLTVHPHPSAFALACARLGWPAAEVELVSAVGRPADVVARLLQPGRRLVVYATGADGAAAVAGALRERGFGPSRFVVLEHLGGPGERRHEATADGWGDGAADPLHAVAIEVRVAPGTPLLPTTPGLPDDAYGGDGQRTRRHVRALALVALAPLPGQLLWDVGAGSGSIAIEWLRAERTARAVAVEQRTDRAAQLTENARRLGVPHLHVVTGSAPGALASLPTPDAIFVGGGLTTPGLLDVVWRRLAPGGRLVADAVTLEGEQVLSAARTAHGGELLRIVLSHAEPLGRFTAWSTPRPIVQWSATKPAPDPEAP
jgi:precorrin-6Y C5,15-methyltransferase (decarboxylating)